MDAATGFVLHRIVMSTAMSAMLAVFGSYALQLMLMGVHRAATIPSRSSKLRRWRPRKR